MNKPAIRNHKGGPTGNVLKSLLKKLNAPISDGNISVTMLHLSNIAWEVNRELQLSPRDAHIQGDPAAMKLWGREYEKGWEPKI